MHRSPSSPTLRRFVVIIATCTIALALAPQAAGALGPDTERTIPLTLTAGVSRELIPHRQSLAPLPGGASRPRSSDAARSHSVPT